MNLRIYNSASQQKEEFQTLEPQRVKMYVCGPTVYDYLHVGNFRGPVFFNLVRNWLEFLGYKVDFVYNFTDVDDRIIDRASKEGVPAVEVSERYIAEFKKDYHQLGLRPHTANPKVTEHMQTILDFIADLVRQGKAYAIKGDVYFSIKDFPTYGSLSNRKIDDLLQGVRVELEEGKRHPGDFALWKAAKEGDVSWASPWGEGRPGWHIECSAMIRAILGDQIDIHGGGLDLLFPHHENEIAQSEGASGRPFVRYWMHNNMLNFSGQKMSKSVGNIVTLREFLESYHPEIYKWLILSVHYRSLSDFSDQAIHRSIQTLAKFYSGLNLAREALGEKTAEIVSGPVQTAEFQAIVTETSAALCDDFNTPILVAGLHQALHCLHGQVRRGQKPSAKGLSFARDFLAHFQWVTSLTQLFSVSPAEFLIYLDDLLLKQKNLSRSEIDAKVAARTQARAQKDFANSDRLRDELLQMGVAVSDTAAGTVWEVDKGLVEG